MLILHNLIMEVEKVPENIEEWDFHVELEGDDDGVMEVFSGNVSGHALDGQSKRAHLHAVLNHECSLRQTLIYFSTVKKCEQEGIRYNGR